MTFIENLGKTLFRHYKFPSRWIVWYKNTTILTSINPMHSCLALVLFLEKTENSKIYKKQVSINIYLVCGNTTCVSTCQIDYVLLRTCLALYSTTTEWIFRSRETSQIWKELSCFWITTLGVGKQLVNTTTLALVDHRDFSLLASLSWGEL